ncbi:MAG: DUF5063 domain-containing protein [Bacteroidetes bacterium]|nr:DUF5063 domain-containing protein [Bacteroidota bacterium]
MHKTPKEILESENFQSFLKSVKDVIEFFERGHYGDYEIFVFEVRKKLLTYYSAAIDLEEVEQNDEAEYFHSFKIEKELTKAVHEKSEEVLKENQWYIDTFNPVEVDGQKPTGGWLVDDFEDIYKDLKENIVLLEDKKETAYEYVIWNFRYSFLIHTGQHCIDAIRALHFLIERILNQRDLDAIVPFEPEELE